MTAEPRLLARVHGRPGQPRPASLSPNVAEQPVRAERSRGCNASAATLYSTIVADPPWQMPGGGPATGSERWTRNHARAETRPSSLPYHTMNLAEIVSLPVADMAAQDAHLYLWVPNAFLEQSYGVARAWGFKPSQMLVWTKTPRGLGLGGAYTNTAEYVLFARRGSLAPLVRQDSSWFHWKRPHNAHSAKPDGFLDLVESVSPGPYLEMFARRNRLGWDTWGDEALNHVSLGAPA